MSRSRLEECIAALEEQPFWPRFFRCSPSRSMRREIIERLRFYAAWEKATNAVLAEGGTPEADALRWANRIAGIAAYAEAKYEPPVIKFINRYEVTELTTILRHFGEQGEKPK